MLKKVIIFLISVTSFNSLTTCDSGGPGYFKILSKTVLTIKENSPPRMQITGKCFSKIFLTYLDSEKEINIKVEVSEKLSYLCLEFLIISSGKSIKPKLLLLSGTHFFTFDKNYMTSNEKNYIKTHGLKILRNCDNSWNWLKSTFMTFKLFAGLITGGSHLPIYQEKANMDMIEKLTDFKWQYRKSFDKIQIKKEDVHSGDFFAISRFDGLDNVIHLGTGSRVGHSTMALWRGDVLYICESQDAEYFPRKGIQCNEFDQWVVWAEEADFNISILPLKEEMKEVFDEDKTWEFIDKLIENKTNYGFHNFIYGWIDTPDQNLPDFLDLDFLSILLRLLDNFIPDIIKKMFTDGMNKRLDTNNLSLTEIWEEIYKKNITFGELLAIVEKDEWDYNDGKNFVCSSFVVSMYQHAGLFGDIKINATEFTPKDLYELDIFDVSGKYVPEYCKDSAPRGYCQFTGRIDMDLGDIGIVKPYDHMNENCPSMIPDFKRVQGC